MAVLFIKKVPADAAVKMGRLMLLALEYKLDSVCNAERVPRYRRCSCSPMGTRTKINYKESIALYIVFVNTFHTKYRMLHRERVAPIVQSVCYTACI